MSTRGGIGILVGPKGRDYRAVYIRSDAYPAYALLAIAGKTAERGDSYWVEELLHSGAELWTFLEHGNRCPYCGEEGVMAVNISGVIYGACIKGHELYEQWLERVRTDAEAGSSSARDILRSLEECGYPDPLRRMHDHANGEENSWDKLSADPLFIEWMWLFDIDEVLHVIAHAGVSRSLGKDCEPVPIEILGGSYIATSYNHCTYVHFEAARITKSDLLRLAEDPKLGQRYADELEGAADVMSIAVSAFLNASLKPSGAPLEDLPPFIPLETVLRIADDRITPPAAPGDLR